MSWARAVLDLPHDEVDGVVGGGGGDAVEEGDGAGVVDAGGAAGFAQRPPGEDPALGRIIPAAAAVP